MVAPSVGTCMVFGTASTIACRTEAMGLSLPMGATIPPPHAGGIRPSEILTASSFRNAQVVMQAIGGSADGTIHLTAIAKGDNRQHGELE